MRYSALLPLAVSSLTMMFSGSADIPITEHVIYPTGDVARDTQILQGAIDNAAHGDRIVMKAASRGGDRIPWVLGAPLTNNFFVTAARNGVPVGASLRYDDPGYGPAWIGGAYALMVEPERLVRMGLFSEKEIPQAERAFAASAGNLRAALRQGIDINKRLTITGENDEAGNPLTVITTAREYEWETYTQRREEFGPFLAALAAYRDMVGWHLHSHHVTLENLHFDRFGGLVEAWHPFTARNLKFTKMGYAPLWALFDARIFWPDFDPSDPASYRTSVPASLRTTIDRVVVGTEDGPVGMGPQIAGSGVTIRDCRIHVSPAHHPALTLIPVTPTVLAQWGTIGADGGESDLVLSVAKDNVVENCDIEVGSGGRGILLRTDLGGVRVQNNVIRNSRIKALPRAVAAIVVGGTSSDNLLTCNRFSGEFRSSHVSFGPETANNTFQVGLGELEKLTVSGKTAGNEIGESATCAVLGVETHQRRY